VDAAAFIMIYATSHHALVDRAQLKAGETVLVLGAAGGVGTPPSRSPRPWAPR
jgi:NADPH2:quinone reductase